MAEVIIMPKLGYNMDEGQLIKWHKNIGDTVTKGEELFEINTDKTVMAVEATEEGTLLKIMLEEGAFAPVFTPIAVIGQPNEDIDAVLASQDGLDRKVAQAQKAETPTSTPEATPVSTISQSDLKLSPKAKKLIKDEGIDPVSLAGIQGTGFQGGITAKDIKASPLAYNLAKKTGVDLSAIQGTGVGGKIMKDDVLQAEKTPKVDNQDKKVLSVTPYKGVRKIIGERLSQSKFTAPHLYFCDSIDTTNLTSFRRQLNEMSEVKIAVSDLLTMAAAKTIRQYPNVNASLVDDEIIAYKSINIGTAVAGNNGLVVPVVKNVQEKTISEVATESRNLISKAKEGRLAQSDYSGGTFTISNLGMFGIENFTAIINLPEAAILSVSSVRKIPVVITNENGEDIVTIRPMMKVQLSVDHRIIDGLLAAQFVGYFKTLLENPVRILM